MQCATIPLGWDCCQWLLSCPAWSTRGLSSRIGTQLGRSWRSDRDPLNDYKRWIVPPARKARRLQPLRTTQPSFKIEEQDLGISVVSFIWNNLIMWRTYARSHAHNLVEHCAIVMMRAHSCKNLTSMVTKIMEHVDVLFDTQGKWPAPSLSVISFPDHIDSFQWQEH